MGDGYEASWRVAVVSSKGRSVTIHPMQSILLRMPCSPCAHLRAMPTCRGCLSTTCALYHPLTRRLTNPLLACPALQPASCGRSLGRAAATRPTPTSPGAWRSPRRRERWSRSRQVRAPCPRACRHQALCLHRVLFVGWPWWPPPQGAFFVGAREWVPHAPATHSLRRRCAQCSCCSIVGPLCPWGDSSPTVVPPTPTQPLPWPLMPTPNPNPMQATATLWR